MFKNKIESEPLYIKIIIFFALSLALSVITFILFYSISDVNDIRTLMFLQTSILLIPFLATYLSFYGHFKYLKFNLKSKNILYVLLGIILIVFSIPIIELLSILSQKIFSSQFINMNTDFFETTLLGITNDTSIKGITYNVIIIAFLPAICEELLFRGTFQNLLTKKYNNPHLQIIITSLIFALAHLNSKSILPIILLGLILGYSYFYSKNILVPIIIHFTNNLFALIYLYVEREDSFKVENYSIVTTVSSLIIVFNLIFLIKKYIISRMT